METEFFLAANSGRGFYSLYDEFPGDGNFLHIIKGGPGTGKSGFMRRIAAAARERGMDTELIRCSGDPDSLDGVFIPALKQAWMDGTAPHVREPGVFGVDSDYVNLGLFCKLPLSADEAANAAEINRQYKALYALAYGWLKAEAAAADMEEADNTAAEAEAEAILRDITGKITSVGEGRGKQRRRFISAISCKGNISLNDTANKLCKQNYLLGADVCHRILPKLAKHLADFGVETILCPEPLRPWLTEGIILPEEGIFIGTKPGKTELEPIRKTLRERAVDALSRAKQLHDELEAVYKPHMDFAALNAYTQEYIEKLFE